MARPARPWFRFYVEAFSDRKLRRLKVEHRWLFVACLGAARQSPRPGILLVADGHPMDEYDLADYAGLDVRTVRAGLVALGKMGLIVKGSPGDLEEIAYRSPAFQNRQFESDDVTKRTRKHRSTSADEPEGTFQRGSQERSKNGDGNAPETETETETDKEQGGKPPAARKRAHRLPVDFAPNDTNRRIAAERGLNLNAVVAQFTDHHVAKGSTFVDWNLALNTWLRRERPGNVERIDTRSVGAPIEAPPDGATDEEAHAWYAEYEARLRAGSRA